MSQTHKKVTTAAYEGSEAVLARCNMSGQKGRRVKLDATHLLNFTTESRHHGHYGGSSGANNRAKRSAAYTRGYTKDNYLLSNAHFVVEQDLDYEGYLSDPDQMVPWSCVLQVRLLSTSPISCPICLFPPEAARIARCGHAYCLPCLSHFFSVSGERWQPCPVCGEIIKLSDARPAVLLQKREFRPGDLINLVRTGRPPDSNYPLPCYLGRGECRLMLASSDKGVQFSKLIGGDPQFKRQALIRDKKELTRSLKDALCDAAFVRMSLEMLETQLEESQPVDTASEIVSDSANDNYTDHSQDEFLDELNSPLEEDRKFAEIDTSCSIEDTYASSKHSVEDWVYLYQAADGQYIFLDPLNIAMLREEYGLLARCPDRIRTRILYITHHVVTEQLRHRYKWLSHLPLLCDVQFVEVSLRPPLVSQHVTDSFRDTVEKRRVGRQAKQEREEREERRAAAYWSKTFPSQILCESHAEKVPDFSIESFTPLPTAASSILTDHVPLPSSFAQALSHQSTPSIKPAPPLLALSVDSVDSPVESVQTREALDEEFAPPTYQESMSDAIATKLDAYLLQKDLEAVPKSKIPHAPSRSKRGKGKKVVLFSTYASRPN